MTVLPAITLVVGVIGGWVLRINLAELPTREDWTLRLRARDRDLERAHRQVVELQAAQGSAVDLTETGLVDEEPAISIH